ncbi:MAG: GIY-YIG nuclease family protein, partial [Flavobacterium sp.]
MQRRVYEHINKTNTSCFTTNYNVIELIYYEQSIYINNAITREKELKEWKKDSHNK